MKYVVFLDILGFKERIKYLNQKSSIQFMTDFSSTIHRLWDNNENFKLHLDGYIVSDSLVLSTKDTTSTSLTLLVDAVKTICSKEFSENSILMRGAITKGEFDILEAKELQSLSKRLIVGQAYVDAYLLEGSVKTLGIVLSSEVFEDVNELNSRNEYFIEEEKINNQKSYILRYLSIDFLMDMSNLKKFIYLATTAKWLPHYYNALYFSLKKEDQKKVSQVFSNIITLINDNEPSEHWRDLDLFIENAFDSNVIYYFRRMFLGFLRSKIN